MSMYMIHRLRKLRVFIFKTSKVLDLLNDVYVIFLINTYIFVYQRKITYSTFIVMIRIIFLSMMYVHVHCIDYNFAILYFFISIPYESTSFRAEFSVYKIMKIYNIVGVSRHRDFWRYVFKIKIAVLPHMTLVCITFHMRIMCIICVSYSYRIIWVSYVADHIRIRWTLICGSYEVINIWFTNMRITCITQV